MSTEIQRAFIGVEASLTLYGGQALLNSVFEFVFNDESETPYDFPAISDTYLVISNERSSRTLKSFSQSNGLTRSGNNLIFNASELDMTFEDYGSYFYEMGYVRTGGYEVVLRYGELIVI